MTRAVVSGSFVVAMIVSAGMSYLSGVGREWMFLHGIVLGLWVSTWARDVER